jgi:hypothetical protein
MSSFHKKLAVFNADEIEVELFLELFLPYVYILAPKQHVFVHVESTDKALIEETSPVSDFTIWIDRRGGIAVYPPGRGDLIVDFYVIDASSGVRLQGVPA